MLQYKLLVIRVGLDHVDPQEDLGVELLAEGVDQLAEGEHLVVVVFVHNYFFADFAVAAVRVVLRNGDPEIGEVTAHHLAVKNLVVVQMVYTALSGVADVLRLHSVPPDQLFPYLKLQQLFL